MLRRTDMTINRTVDRWGGWLAIGALVVWAVPAAAATNAEKCEAAKLKVAGKYSSCRLKAEAKAVLTGNAVDYSTCDGKLALKWGTTETGGGGLCPTNGDLADVQNQVTTDADLIALKLTGVRFVDNGDDTVSDVATGLTWEKKDDLGGIHDKDDLYAWSTTGTAPDGAAFTGFLAALNNGSSADGTTIGGCFAGHCDWRLPTSAELQTILLEPSPCGTSPCIDPIFGATQAGDYWSTTSSMDSIPDGAWIVYFDDGGVSIDTKIFGSYVRAVRGGM